MQITILVFFFQMPVVAPVASVEPSEGADVRAEEFIFLKEVDLISFVFQIVRV